jgi:hypothetical protein
MNAMEAKEYDVEVVYRQRAIYRVRAADRESAEKAAVQCWQSSEESVVAGYDWAELDGVYVAESPDEQREEQDTQLVFRFLRERERLIRRLAAGGLEPSQNDAISAAQVAADLGWTRRTLSSASTPDLPRAARALERLCGDRRVVCFQRPRVREGERGEIRLYCTPEYLDRLTSELDEVGQAS